MRRTKKVDVAKAAIRKELEADPSSTARQVGERVAAAKEFTTAAFAKHVGDVRKELGIEPPSGGRSKPPKKAAKVQKEAEQAASPTTKSPAPAKPPAANGLRPRPADPAPPADVPAELPAPVEVHSRDLHLVMSRQGDRVAIVLNATLSAFQAQELIKMVTRDALSP